MPVRFSPFENLHRAWPSLGRALIFRPPIWPTALGRVLPSRWSLIPTVGRHRTESILAFSLHHT